MRKIVYTLIKQSNTYTHKRICLRCATHCVSHCATQCALSNIHRLQYSYCCVLECYVTLEL